MASFFYPTHYERKLILKIIYMRDSYSFNQSCNNSHHIDLDMNGVYFRVWDASKKAVKLKDETLAVKNIFFSENTYK